MGNPDHICTPEQLAKVLGIQVRTLLKWAREGRVPRIKAGHRTVRFRFADVMAALEARPAG